MTNPLESLIDLLGFDLDGWKLGLVGREESADHAALRRIFPRACIAALGSGETPGPEAVDLALLPEAADPDAARRAAAAWLPHCRWFATTLPDGPAHWEALDDFEVAHRVAFAVHRPPAAARALRFGYLLRGRGGAAAYPIRPARELLLPATREPPLARTGTRLLFLSSQTWARMLAGDYYDPAYIRVLHPSVACEETCDAHFNPGTETFPAAADRVLEDWKPDAVLVVAPEYAGVPLGMEDSPWPTVGLVSDWNLNLRDLAACLGAFDLVLADANGVQRLRALGFEGVHYWPMYSYDNTLHRPAGGPKTHDLAFIGNLNHRVQRQRSRYVRRIAELAETCKVFIASGLYGERYAAALGAARVVFNRSVRGELNLRCYEGPACGALLLLEDTNSEARTLFRDGEHCAYYSDEDLTSVAARYLADPDLRERVTAAGTERVRASSYGAHFSGLLALVRDLAAAPAAGRPFRGLPESERLARLGRLAWRRTANDRLYWAHSLLFRAHELDPTSPRVQADLGAVYAAIADEVERGEAGSDADPAIAELGAAAEVRARALFASALRASPDDGVAALNWAWFLRRRDPQLATRLLARVVESDRGPIDGVLFPLEFRHLEVELETTWHELMARPAERESELRRLLAWQAAVWLGDQAAGAPGWTAWAMGPASVPAAPDLATAVRWYRLAADLRPDLAESQTKLGEALLGTGDPAGATAAFVAALDDNPLSVRTASGLVVALAQVDRTAEATAVYDSCLAILPAVPQLLDALPALRRTFWQAMAAAGAHSRVGVQLEGMRATNFLLFADGPPEAWLPGLDAYLAEVPPGRDACLVVYGTGRPPESVLADIRSRIDARGLDADRIPDILVVDRALSGRQEEGLVAGMSGVYSGLPAERRNLVESVGCPILGSFKG